MCKASRRRKMYTCVRCKWKAQYVTSRHLPVKTSTWLRRSYFLAASRLRASPCVGSVQDQNCNIWATLAGLYYFLRNDSQIYARDQSLYCSCFDSCVLADLEKTAARRQLNVVLTTTTVICYNVDHWVKSRSWS